jgi:hypothetical protein
MRWRGVALSLVLWSMQLLLAVFFGFVGFMKAFAPMAELQAHHAWVAALSPVIARVVGWSEMLCAAGLVVPGRIAGRRPLAAVAALSLLANQLVAIFFHWARGELADALPQNLLLIGLLALVAWGRLAPRADRQARLHANGETFVY